MAKLAPSILSADFCNLANEIDKVELGGADYLHLDVMDGSYVPNITFGQPLIKSIRKATKMPFDVHLMVDKPEKFIKHFFEAGADIITVHAEATTHIHRTIQIIKSYGIKAGVSLNPATPLAFLDYIMEDLDLILLMTVNPGFGGQSFIPAMKGKIRDTKIRIANYNSKVILEVDGGIKLDNVEEIIKCGADLIVVGSDIFGATDVVERTKSYKKILNK